MDKIKKQQVNKLVQLYFFHNPHMNKGMGFRAKANDIITQYIFAYNKSYEDLEECIKSYPMCPKPIWEQFKNFFNNNKKEDSYYKSSVEDSTDVDDWI